jgi:hypothetical protein
MIVTFKTDFDAEGLAMAATIQIQNVVLNDENFQDFRRYFEDLAHSFSIDSDGVNHTLYIDFGYNAQLGEINDAIYLVQDDLVEVA